jgi:CRISPR-associated endonuclease/helicase Cas3
VEQHHLLLPAKFGGVNGVYGFHPLICHMLDTAAVARAIWDEVLPPAQRRAIADALHVTDESARRWCAFLAGTHDLGKAAPAFLSHEPAKPLWPALPPALRPGPSLQPRDAPHGFVTTLALKELLPGVFGIEEGVAWRLAAISGGHHGILPSRSEVEALKVTATAGSPSRSADRRVPLSRCLIVAREPTTFLGAVVSRAESVFFAPGDDLVEKAAEARRTGLVSARRRE